MIFVTGGTGVLGAHLMFDLTQSDTPIRAFYRSKDRISQIASVFKFYNPENWQSQFEKIEWVQGDILDITEVLESMEGCSHVYHLAALVSFHPKDFTKMMKVNREGTENIVNACLHHNIKKLCYVSSTAAIGGEDKVISEKTKWKNEPTTSGYSVSKYSAEREVWRGIEEGLNAVIVNPCVILGAGNWKESSLTIFKTVSKGISFYPPGSNATVDARDVSTIMTNLMTSEINAERYLCIGSNQSFKELMTAIAKEIDVKPPKRKVSKWVISIARRFLDVANWIVGSRSDITKDTVNNLYALKSYDNSKVVEALNFDFRPLEEQVKNAVAGRID